MAAILCFLAMVRGSHLSAPLLVIASTVLGHKAENGSAGAIAVGLVLHFCMAAFLGMLFTFLAGPTTRVRLLALGLLYCVVIWGISQFVVLPLVDADQAMHLGTVWTSFVGHLAFGLLLAASVPTREDIDG